MWVFCLVFIMGQNWFTPGSGSGLLVNGEPGEPFPIECLLRDYHYSVELIDDHGRCSVNISTQACYGACDTIDLGNAEGSPTAQQHVCVPTSTIRKTVDLTHCNRGVDTPLTSYTYLEATECGCRSCETTKFACLSRQYKVDEETSSSPSPSKRTSWGPYRNRKVPVPQGRIQPHPPGTDESFPDPFDLEEERYIGRNEIPRPKKPAVSKKIQQRRAVQENDDETFF